MKVYLDFKDQLDRTPLGEIIIFLLSVHANIIPTIAKVENIS
jgi:hypothetical protein